MAVSIDHDCVMVRVNLSKQGLLIPDKGAHTVYGKYPAGLTYKLSEEQP
jgi:hypothetical protein